MNRLIMSTFCLFVLVACDKSSSNEPKPDDPVSKNTPTNATAAAPAAAATPVTIDETDLATPADFEEAAEKAIDAKSYKTELTALESDINRP
jgi:hypothetical protein